jgi:hypothetical protein
MSEPTHLDGNVAAGDLGDIFAVDVTTAVGQCAGCGRRGPMSDTRVYTGGPGLVVRCVGCDAVLMRVVSGGGRRWLELRGLAVLQLSS